MNKRELIAEAAARTDVPEATVKKVLDALLTSITETNLRGHRVIITGFGSFGVRDTAQRTVFNPRTRELMTAPARRRPVFRPGAELRRRIAEGNEEGR